MRVYLAQRLAMMLVTIWAVLTIVFFMIRLAPGDPTTRFIREDLPAEAIIAQRQAWGLDRPLYVQYLEFLRNLTTLEFGTSFQQRTPVSDLLWSAVGNTLILLVPATLLMTIGGAMLGAVAGWRRGSRFEASAVVLSLLLRSMPTFFIGMLLLLLFAYTWQWLPPGGMSPPGTFPTYREMLFSATLWKHLALPTLAVVLHGIYAPMLLMRTSIIEFKGEDFVEVLRAKGLPERSIIRHAARNAILPLITSTAITFALLVDGQVVLEQVFSWPGAGRLVVQAMLDRDYPVLQASFFLVAVSVVVANFIADLLYGYLDPRVRYS
ncbi:MAG: ABC transporter permease [Dehalococcoidia bacterium]